MSVHFIQLHSSYFFSIRFHIWCANRLCMIVQFNTAPVLYGCKSVNGSLISQLRCLAKFYCYNSVHEHTVRNDYITMVMAHIYSKSVKRPCYEGTNLTSATSTLPSARQVSKQTRHVSRNVHVTCTQDFSGVMATFNV